MTNLRLAFTIFISTLFAGSAFSQWSANSATNTAISTASFAQYNHAVISDGSGGVIVAWLDQRNSNNDVYVQKLNAAGVAQWTSDGVPICTAGDGKNAISLTSDGSGGAILAWEDSRITYAQTDIFAQRINSAGTVLWTNEGIAICTFSGSELNPKIVFDGSGGAIITWSSGGNIYGQRVNSDSVTQWTSNGIVICDATGNQSNPQIVSDGSGGAIISWIDPRTNGTTGWDIYAQRVNSSGAAQWTANGVVVCNATSNQTSLKMVSDDSSGAVITWQDLRSDASGDIYAQRMIANGTAKWTANGVALCTSSNAQSVPVITFDGNKGAMVAWQDLRGGTTSDIYVQWVDSYGVTQWTSQGEAVCTSSDNQTNPSVIADGNGGVIVAWEDYRSGTTNDIYSQLINGGGQWTANGVATGTASSDQTTPLIVTDAANGAIIVWLDERSSSFGDIYASRVTSDGALLPVEMIHFDANVNSYDVELVWKTSTETNNYGFDVERRVIGEARWTKVTFLAGSGTSTSPHEYCFTDHDLPPGRYAYRIKQIDNDGTFQYYGNAEVEIGLVAKKFELESNYPNPFNPSTTLRFTLAEDGRARLRTFNILGEEVATLFDEVTQAGREHEVKFDASSLPSGVYFSILEFGSQRHIRKMLLMK